MWCYYDIFVIFLNHYLISWDTYQYSLTHSFVYLLNYLLALFPLKNYIQPLYAVHNILFGKSNDYPVIGLVVNQNTDNLIEVTDRNRQIITQELIENLLKEQKEKEHAYRLNIYHYEGYEKILPLTKMTPTDLPPIKFK